MKWTTAVPTQPGFYWVDVERFSITSDEIVLVDGVLYWSDKDGLDPLLETVSYWEKNDIRVEWYGPIEPPAKESK